MAEEKQIQLQDEQMLMFHDSEENTDIKVKMLNETVWLTQDQMAKLFHTTKQNISKHVKNIFIEGELQQNSVVKDLLTTADDGKNYQTAHYNLDMIISVGYRVNSRRGTEFRIWATGRLKEYIIKGYAVDERRLQVSIHAPARGATR